MNKYGNRPPSSTTGGPGPSSRAPSVLSGRSRPGSLAGSDGIGPSRPSKSYNRSGRGTSKSGTPASFLGGPGESGPSGSRAASRPGSSVYRSEYGRDGEEDEEDQEEMASDYGDPQDEEEEEGEHGKQKKEKGLLSLEEERVLSEFKQREVDLQELRALMDRDQQRRLDELKSTNFTFQSIQKIYRDRYPGAGHIAKNVAALVGVVSKTHLGEVIELAKTLQLERIEYQQTQQQQKAGTTSSSTASPSTSNRPAPPLTPDDMKTAFRIYLERAGQVAGTAGPKVGGSGGAVGFSGLGAGRGLFGGWI